MIYTKLNETTNLTQTEEIIATFILEDPRTVIDSSLEKFSNRCHVSQASVIRLCKKLGVSGFSEFKVKLASELPSFASSKKFLSVDFPIPDKADTEDIADIFYSLSLETLEREYKNLDLRNIKKAARLLNHADNIYIYGRGASLIIGEDFHYKLLRTGFSSILETPEGFQEARTFNIRNKSTHKNVALVISHSANTIYFRYIIEELNINNIPFILLTASDNHLPYGELASVTLHVNSSENKVKKLGSFTSRNAMLYVLDCLFGELFNLNYEENKKNLLTSSDRKRNRNFFYE